MEQPPEVFLDFTDMSNRPTTVYAIRVVGRDNTNTRYARTRLFVKRASMERLLAILKEDAPPGLVQIEQYEGTITWNDRITPKKKRAVKTKTATTASEDGKPSDPPSADAQLAHCTREEGDQSHSAADCTAPPIRAGWSSSQKLLAGQSPDLPSPSSGRLDASSGPG